MGGSLAAGSEVVVRTNPSNGQLEKVTTTPGEGTQATQAESFYPDVFAKITSETNEQGKEVVKSISFPPGDRRSSSLIRDLEYARDKYGARLDEIDRTHETGISPEEVADLDNKWRVAERTLRRNRQQREGAGLAPADRVDVRGRDAAILQEVLADGHEIRAKVEDTPSKDGRLVLKPGGIDTVRFLRDDGSEEVIKLSFESSKVTKVGDTRKYLEAALKIYDGQLSRRDELPDAERASLPLRLLAVRGALEQDSSGRQVTFSGKDAAHLYAAIEEGKVNHDGKNLWLC